MVKVAFPACRLLGCKLIILRMVVALVAVATVYEQANRASGDFGGQFGAKMACSGPAHDDVKRRASGCANGNAFNGCAAGCKGHSV